MRPFISRRRSLARVVRNGRARILEKKIEELTVCIKKKSNLTTFDGRWAALV